MAVATQRFRCNQVFRGTVRRAARKRWSANESCDVDIEPPMVVDAQRSLDVRVKRFDQPRPVALREMLTEFEEFLGVPIRTEDQRIPPAQLDRTVTILLEDTTFGEVLKSVTEQAGLSFEIQDGEIVLIPSQE